MKIIVELKGSLGHGVAKQIEDTVAMVKRLYEELAADDIEVRWR